MIDVIAGAIGASRHSECKLTAAVQPRVLDLGAAPRALIALTHLLHGSVRRFRQVQVHSPVGPEQPAAHLQSSVVTDRCCIAAVRQQPERIAAIGFINKAVQLSSIVLRDADETGRIPARCITADATLYTSAAEFAPAAQQ